MEDWQRAPALYEFAQALLGQEALDAWLRGQLQQHPRLLQLFVGEVFERVDAGPLVDRLCELCTMPSTSFDAVMPNGQDLQNFRDCQSLLFNGLIQKLPLEQLNDEFLERRLALDVGL
jgi:hypothetical protein